MIDQILGMGVSALYATNLMGLLGLHPDELLDAARFERFKDVLMHLKDNQQYEYIVNKLTRGKSVDKLDHLWSYGKLEKQKMLLEKDREEVQKNLNTILRLAGDKQITDPNDVVGYSDCVKMLDGANDGLRRIEDEMSFYER